MEVVQAGISVAGDARNMVLHYHYNVQYMPVVFIALVLHME
jgi:hypothetical protein